jgi:hypothetical protein
MTKMDRKIFNNAAKAFVDSLSNEQLSKVDDLGCRVYAYVTDENAAPEFRLSIGSPIDSAPHKWHEAELHADALAYSNSNQYFEGWQEEKNKNEDVREGILRYLEDSAFDDLVEAIARREDESAD